VEQNVEPKDVENLFLRNLFLRNLFLRKREQKGVEQKRGSGGVPREQKNIDDLEIKEEGVVIVN